MATRVQTLCDVCQTNDDIATEAQSLTIGFDGRTYTIDLCDAHKVAIFDQMAEAVRAFGRRERAGTQGKGPPNRPHRRTESKPEPVSERMCLAPGCEFVIIGDPEARMRYHLRKWHGVDITVVKELGIEAALAGEGARFVCQSGECLNAEYPQYFASGTGYAAHLKAKHGMTLDRLRREMKKTELPE